MPRPVSEPDSLQESRVLNFMRAAYLRTSRFSREREGIMTFEYQKPGRGLYACLMLLLLVLGLAWVSGSAQAATGPTVADNPLLTPTATPTCAPNYTVAQSTASGYNTGTTLVAASRCDDCAFTISLPFAYSLYNSSFTTATGSSNGEIEFGTPERAFSNTCLPDVNTTYAIIPHWSDLSMDTNNTACVGCGVYTSVSGTAPNRLFNIEYRAIAWDTNTPVDFIVRLYEGRQRFDIIYVIADPIATPNATIGVQKDNTLFMQYQCPTARGTVLSGTMLAFTLTSQPCATATPSPAPQTLVGHVNWDARPAQPNARQALPVVLTLRPAAGGTLTTFPQQNTDVNGYFTVTLTGLPAGTYNWRAKGPQFLANSGTITVGGSAQINADMGFMRSGDANNDNIVNNLDFILLKPAFSADCSTPFYDARVDFTGDCLVNSADMMPLKRNFGSDGAAPLGVAVPK